MLHWARLVDIENRTAIDLKTVKSWEQEGLIEYLGAVHDVRPMIEAAHYVVLPSYREGAPRTLYYLILGIVLASASPELCYLLGNAGNC